MYSTKVGMLRGVLASVKEGQLLDPDKALDKTGKIVLKNGLVVDPKNKIEEVLDVAISGDEIVEVGKDIYVEKGDMVIDCEGLLVVPGLLDMHLHLGDLFEVSTDPIYGAAADGVTMALSPGAGNTFMAPSLLGAEVDRGVPINLGLYQGAASVLSTMLSVEELIKLYKGELEEEIASSRMTRNAITNTTAPLIVGIKDHMGHFLMSNENIDKIFEITSKAKLIYMTHTQDPEHAIRLIELSKGRPIHLGHATAAGCGTHKDAVESMKIIIDLCKKENVTGEFVTTMLREGGGSREGLIMPKKSQELAYSALEQGIVDVLISDGQNDATMKGFGDTRDNIPAILELAEMGVLSLSNSVATMTSNPARLIAERTGNGWWIEKVGHLGKGALANVTVINREVKSAAYTIVNGEIVGFESRAVRRGSGAGGFVSKFGMVKRIGVGDLVMFSYKR
ncbi:amidohydrolase family protein [Tepidimicrobium xylanilyticum]|uniref:amidohydrolase family protein n=1 Tax=Tepidimicrobium xylanilyticum TaxID=1123352 RepID=UPI002654A944|nr:amidohydrolase family protein [Tepidimicrobium xylanilyticum]GMG95384.1 dihydroorotase [Tepidimicrobium xylanilyticum]